MCKKSIVLIATVVREMRAVQDNKINRHRLDLDHPIKGTLNADSLEFNGTWQYI